jgi:single-strand DNA-binding protein
MNRVILMGRLARDPEVRYSQGERQMAIARYTLAVDRRGRREAGQDAQADFIRCVAFDRAAEFAEKYFHQGMRVLVSGRIQTGSYQDRDGKTVYTTDVVIEDQEFADSKGASTGNDGFGNQSYGNQGGQRYSGQSYQPQSRPAPSNAIADGFMNIPDGVDDEGLPFN